MEFGYTLSGSAPLMKDFLATATLDTVGVPVTVTTVASTDRGGVQVAANAAPELAIVGLTVGLAGQTIAIADSGMTDNADLFVRTIVNPDAVYRAKLSGGSTADTALTISTNTSEDTTGVTITGGALIDDGTVWAYSGGNLGQLRRADTTTAVSINFIDTIKVGDAFLSAPGFPGSAEVVTQAFFDLTTNVDQVNASASDGDNGNFLLIDGEFSDITDEGTTNSFYHIFPVSHAFGGNLLLGHTRS